MNGVYFTVRKSSCVKLRRVERVLVVPQANRILRLHVHSLPLAVFAIQQVAHRCPARPAQFTVGRVLLSRAAFGVVIFFAACWTPVREAGFVGSEFEFL